MTKKMRSQFLANCSVAVFMIHQRKSHIPAAAIRDPPRIRGQSAKHHLPPRKNAGNINRLVNPIQRTTEYAGIV